MPLETAPESRVRWPEYGHVIFDCDSTLTTVEGIDVLATAMGMEEEVAALTDSAMEGDVDLTDVYGARLALLQPSRQAITALRSSYKNNVVTDAAAVVAALREIGIAVYVVSGGLAEPVEDFAVSLGIDPGHVRAVTARHDSLSGEWWKPGAGGEDYAGFDDGALTRSDGKAEIITELLKGTTGMSMLVGDGASDLYAADSVDLFVGFGGVVRRERVAADAAVYIDTDSLAPVLPLAAGPGGRQRITTEASRATFDKGAALVASGAVAFRHPKRRDQLLAALDVGRSGDD